MRLQHSHIQLTGRSFLLQCYAMHVYTPICCLRGSIWREGKRGGAKHTAPSQSVNLAFFSIIITFFLLNRTVNSLGGFWIFRRTRSICKTWNVVMKWPLPKLGEGFVMWKVPGLFTSNYPLRRIVHGLMNIPLKVPGCRFCLTSLQGRRLRNSNLYYRRKHLLNTTFKIFFISQ